MAEYYQRRIYDTEDIREPDSLIAGTTAAGTVKLNAGEYKRGEILISAGDYFVKASDPSALKTAEGICVLARDITIPEGSESSEIGYFMGMLNHNELILNDSAVTEYDVMEQVTINNALRKHKLFVR